MQASNKKKEEIQEKFEHKLKALGVCIDRFSHMDILSFALGSTLIQRFFCLSSEAVFLFKITIKFSKFIPTMISIIALDNKIQNSSNNNITKK